MDRRAFLKSSAAAAGQVAAAGALSEQARAAAAAGGTGDSVAGTRPRPNIVLYLSDQFRWDLLGANGLNSSTHTPNLDAMARAQAPGTVPKRDSSPEGATHKSRYSLTLTFSVFILR